MFVSFGAGGFGDTSLGKSGRLARKLLTVFWMPSNTVSDKLLAKEEMDEETEAREAMAEAPALDKESPPASGFGEAGEGFAVGMFSSIKEAGSGVPLLGKVLLTASETARKPSVIFSTKEADMKTGLFPSDESEAAAMAGFPNERNSIPKRKTVRAKM